MKTTTLWSIYIVRCADNTLYTGCTTDIVKRIAKHNAGKGAKYTRSRLPVSVVYTEYCGTHAEALRREYIIKRYTKKKKEHLVSSYVHTKNPHTI